MLTGRLIFSVGCYAQLTLSHQVKSHWFLGRELALAFALYNDSSKLGSIVALASIGELVQRVGLQNTLWISFVICLMGPIAAVISGWVYKTYASVTLDVEIFVDSSRTGDFGFAKLTRLGREYWVIAAMVFFYFGPLFTIIADFPKFITVNLRNLSFLLEFAHSFIHSFIKIDQLI